MARTPPIAPMKRGLLLREIRVDPARGGQRIERLPFLSHGPIEIELRSPLTLLIGENGSGKTTLLEAIAARCAIRPGGGRSYAETEDDREPTAISDAVDVVFGGRRPKRPVSTGRSVCRDHGERGPIADGQDRRMAAGR